MILTHREFIICNCIISNGQYIHAHGFLHQLSGSLAINHPARFIYYKLTSMSINNRDDGRLIMARVPLIVIYQRK